MATAQPSFAQRLAWRLEALAFAGAVALARAFPIEKVSDFGAWLFGALWEARSRYRGGQPIVTRRIARDFLGANVWVTSEKAETQLGYTHRSAREAMARSVRWFLDNGYVSEQAASRVRLELRPV